MASVAASHLVIFIAAIVVSASISGVVLEGATRYGDSVLESQLEHAADVAAAIQIINDPGSPSATYETSTDTLTLYVKNVGGRTIPSEPGDLFVLVNGTYHPVTSITVHDATRWRPETVLVVTVDVALPAGSSTRVVVSAPGARARFTFTTA